MIFINYLFLRKKHGEVVIFDGDGGGDAEESQEI